MQLLAVFLLFCAAAYGEYATLDGHRIWYETEGRGAPALVLLPGWTCDGSIFSAQRPALAKRYRVITIDPPGQGRSDKPEITYDMTLFARSVDAAMRAAKVDKAVLIGYSMGGSIARRTAADFPNRVLGIVSIDGPAFMKFPPDVEAGIRKWVKDFAGPDAAAAREKFMSAMFRPSTTDAVKEKIRAATRQVTTQASSSAIEHTLLTDWSDLPPVKAPALAVNAPSPNPNDTRRASLEKTYPNLTFHEVPDTSHFLLLEKPDEVNRLIIEWVDRQFSGKR